MKCSGFLPFIRVVAYKHAFQNWRNCDFIVLSVSSSVTAIYPNLMAAQFYSGTLALRQQRNVNRVNIALLFWFYTIRARAVYLFYKCTFHSTLF